LCHGELGIIETLKAASLTLAVENIWGRLHRERMDALLGNLLGAGWSNQRPSYAEAPGLMTGLAGIGYGLLRFAYPSAIPNLLLLERPLSP
jgi:lantibiotic modifying enzyme